MKLLQAWLRQLDEQAQNLGGERPGLDIRIWTSHEVTKAIGMEMPIGYDMQNERKPEDWSHRKGN